MGITFTKLLAILLFSAAGLFAQIGPINNGGSTGSGFKSQYISPAAGTTTTVTDNAGLSSPYARVISFIPVGTSCAPEQCLSVTGYAANSFTVYNTLAGTWQVLSANATQPTPTFTLSASAASKTAFANDPVPATFTLTLTAIGGYTGTITPSLQTVTGITCTYSPTTVTNSGTTTATCKADGTASASNAGTVNALTFSATDGTITQTAGSSLTVWTSPVQQWKMNEGTSPMLDSSGNTNNLTNSNATYTNISGLLSNTLTFNGTSTYSSAANATNTNFNGSTAFTVCGWFMQSGNRSVESGLITNFTTSYTGWMAEVRESAGGGNHIRTWLSSTNGSNWLLINWNFVPTLNTAFHMCFETDGTKTATGMAFYANGTATGQVSIDANTLTGSISSTQPITLGLRAPPSVDNTYLAGGAADIRIFNYGLSTAQITAIYGEGAQ